MFDAKSMSDEEIVLLAQNGDSEAMDFILERYKNFVRSKARSYFLVGADHEDIVQEGMIGLYKAIRDYKREKEAPFVAFADVCITRQIISAIKSATRQKHIPLNTYVSLNSKTYDEGGSAALIESVRESDSANPEARLISYEDFNAIKEMLGSMLTKLEMASLIGYMQGQSYQEISESSGYHLKAVDNALQRVKRKLTKYMKERGDVPQAE